jgi:hypothetical protein
MYNRASSVPTYRGRTVWVESAYKKKASLPGAGAESRQGGVQSARAGAPDVRGDREAPRSIPGRTRAYFVRSGHLPPSGLVLRLREDALLLFAEPPRRLAFSKTQLPFLMTLGKGKHLSRLQPFDMFEDSIETRADRHH